MDANILQGFKLLSLAQPTFLIVEGQPSRENPATVLQYVNVTDWDKGTLATKSPEEAQQLLKTVAETREGRYFFVAAIAMGLVKVPVTIIDEKG